MIKILSFVPILIMIGTLSAQTEQTSTDSTVKKIFHESHEKINDLVHTKLEVKFDYQKSWMHGKAWVTLIPHFYSTDSLTLDAKGMDIKEVAIIKGTAKSPLKYKYSGMQLFISLDKLYKGGEKYTIYISYTSKPNELKTMGSAAITDAKGLYFINPNGEDKNKPVQIWTQGETEANSVWMPTIDKPNQKSTQEIFMTVPSKYVTLSNGLLISQKQHADGTRTDYWKMNLPHAPYLFFMGVGEFAIIKDTYKGKEVSYYVEKKEAPFAKGVFGNTPEMLGFFSKILGIEYPWPKYSQMVGRDYVSGAMENTTATLHQEGAYQNSRQLTDGNSWEGTIAHEVIHQWFGDLVTAESWSNLTVNESFANYGEYLWYENKYGKDAADEHNQDDMLGYLLSGSEKKDLVRYHYGNKEEMFDAVSYNKGGLILHMLRNYVGDEAFFKSLNNYLNTNKFKQGEADHIRLAFEEVTGKDLNWFWNQWYFGNGHPVVEINYEYDSAGKRVFVYIKQTQSGNKTFRLPIAIDIYSGKNKKRYNVWMENKSDTFAFTLPTKPDLVNVDADKVLLWDKKDNKNAENFIFQYKYGPNFLDRKEALDYFAANNLEELTLGLSDKYAGLRKLSIGALANSKFSTDPKLLDQIEQIIDIEKDKKTKAEAIMFLASVRDEKYKQLFNKFVDDSSYSVAGSAFKGLIILEPATSYQIAKKYVADAKGALKEAIAISYLINGAAADFDVIAQLYNESQLGQEKLEMTEPFLRYMLKVDDPERIKKGVDYVLKFRKTIPAQYMGFTEQIFKSGLDKLSKTKKGEVAEYIEQNFK